MIQSLNPSHMLSIFIPSSHAFKFSKIKKKYIMRDLLTSCGQFGYNLLPNRSYLTRLTYDGGIYSVENVKKRKNSFKKC